MLAQHTSIAAGLETYWFDLDWKNRNSATMKDRIDRLVKCHRRCLLSELHDMIKFPHLAWLTSRGTVKFGY